LRHLNLRNRNENRLAPSCVRENEAVHASSDNPENRGEIYITESLTDLIYLPLRPGMGLRAFALLRRVGIKDDVLVVSFESAWILAKRGGPPTTPPVTHQKKFSANGNSPPVLRRLMSTGCRSPSGNELAPKTICLEIDHREENNDEMSMGVYSICSGGDPGVRSPVHRGSSR
jgi:hypothetical protein